MSKLYIEIDEKTLRRLVINHLKELMCDIALTVEDVVIEVKNKNNYKSEWESAAFRARIDKSL